MAQVTPAVDVWEPEDSAAVSAGLRDADHEGLAVFPTGAATKIAWTRRPERVDRVLSTLGLVSSIDHRAGDLVATIPAGWTLAAANKVLAGERQWLPLDPPFGDRATIGGLVASNDSGPRRLGCGTPRDLIIGVEMALAGGQRAKAGGRVVKNVAGYDLMRLLCGSFGTLGVITSATFKLAPLPRASLTLVATMGTRAGLAPLALALAAAPIAPSAIDLQSPPHRILVRFETTASAAEHQAATARRLAEGHGASVTIVDGDSERELWSLCDENIWGTGETVLKVSVLPTKIGALLDATAASLAAAGVDWHVGGRAALGVLYITLTGDSARHRDAINQLQPTVHDAGGTLVVHSTAPAVQAGIDPWAESGDARPLMELVKAQFDPRGTLVR